MPAPRFACRCRFGPPSWRIILRVLLADDHGIVRRGLRSLLESEPGLSIVAEAADGLEALRLCEEHAPDTLIVDIAMPKMNGLEVAARVQKLAHPPRVIILSMHADESDILRALAGCARVPVEGRDRRGPASRCPFRCGREAVLQRCGHGGAGRGLHAPAAGAGSDRLVSPPHGSREGSAAAARRGTLEQGSRQPARSRV